MMTRFPSALSLLSLAVSALAFTAGCGTGTTDNTGGTGTVPPVGACKNSAGISIECTPFIKVIGDSGTLSNKSTKVINTSGTGDQTFEFQVLNSGNSPLVIGSVGFDYTPPAPEDTPALSCFGPDGTTSCANMKWPNVAPTGSAGTTSVKIVVRYTAPADSTSRNAKIHIISNDQSKPTTIPDFQINIKTASGVPKIVTPAEVDMGFVKAPQTSAQTFQIKNQGTADLIIPDIDATALDDSFTLVIDGTEYKCAQVIHLDPAIGLKPGDTKDVQIVYVGKDDNPRTGDLILHTNDPSLTAEGGAGWKRVAVKVNSTGPCLKVVPTDVIFGGVAVSKVGTQKVILKSCGDEAVKVTSLAFDAKGAGNFAIDFASISATGGKEPSETAPLVIDKNSMAQFNVTYTPAAAAEKGPDGNPVLDTATVVVTAPESPSTPVNVQLSGFGSTGDCPTSVVQVLEGEAVVPQTVLHLDGSQSYSTGGTVSKYKWTVTPPPGSVSKYSPTDSAKTVTFQPNVAGDYIFCLVVTDDQGKDSCAPGCKTVKVLPDQAIHVELTWHTPLDKDEADEGPDVGADLDLHFAHDYAAQPWDLDLDGMPDPWCAQTYDCYWYTCGSGKVVEWGSYDPNVDDNPHLDRDDTDGAGPENLNLTLPEEGKTYRVGVFYYNDHGFGPSIATARIYVYGSLVYEAALELKKKKDLWFVATISWPSGSVDGEVINGNKNVVTANYPCSP
jgi:hypothetical protein